MTADHQFLLYLAGLDLIPARGFRGTEGLEFEWCDRLDAGIERLKQPV